MSVLKVLIVEDEAVIAQHLWLLLEDLGYEVVGRASKYSRAIELISSSEPDLVLLDIVLGGAKDGVDVAEHIRKEWPGLPFIFLTSHADPKTVERAKAAQPYGYLLKPFEREDLYASIEIAMGRAGGLGIETEPEETFEFLSGDKVATDSIFIKDRHVYQKIRFSDIAFLKAEGNYVDINTTNRTLSVRSSLRSFMERIPEDLFFRIHRSYAVNLSKVDSINPNEIIVQGDPLPTTKEFRDALLDRLNTI